MALLAWILRVYGMLFGVAAILAGARGDFWLMLGAMVAAWACWTLVELMDAFDGR